MNNPFWSVCCRAFDIICFGQMSLSRSNISSTVVCRGDFRIQDSLSHLIKSPLRSFLKISVSCPDNMSLLSLACCHVHHLLVTELPAEHLGVGDWPVHGHEPWAIMPVVAAKGEGACLEDNILANCMYNTEILPLLVVMPWLQQKAYLQTFYHFLLASSFLNFYSKTHKNVSKPLVCIHLLFTKIPNCQARAQAHIQSHTHSKIQSMARTDVFFTVSPTHTWLLIPPSELYPHHIGIGIGIVYFHIKYIHSTGLDRPETAHFIFTQFQDKK